MTSGSRPAEVRWGVAGPDEEVPERCRSEMPPLAELSPGHTAACWYPVEPGERLHAAAHA